MEQSLFAEFAKSGPTILIMAIMIYWFIKQIEKKDIQGKENLDLFLTLQKDSNAIHSKTGELLQVMVVKLNEVHETMTKCHSNKK